VVRYGVPDPTSFLQTADGDLDFSQGLRRTPDLTTYVKQKLSQTLNFWEGEWFLDLRQGLPYGRLIIGKKPDLALIRDLMRAAALKTRGVGGLGGVTTGFANTSRTVTVRPFEVRTTAGEAVDLGPFVLERFK
jgi:hypothetical protein